MTGSTGTTSSVEVTSSDGTEIDCTSGSGSYTPLIDGVTQMSALATVTLNGQTASAVSNIINLVTATAPPTVTWYEGPQYAPSGQGLIPLRSSPTSDADLVILNGMTARPWSAHRIRR